MKSTFLLLVSLALLLGLAAAGVPAEKPVTNTVVPLIVTIQDYDSFGNLCRIRSDCSTAPAPSPNCPYVNGMAGIAANLDASGNLIIGFQTGRSADRLLYFDYGSPLSPQNHTPISGLYAEGHLATLPINSASYTAIQNMSVGAVQCVQLGWSYTLSDAKKTQWRHNFHRELLSFDLSQTSYAVVTRTDVNTWEVEPKASSCNPANAVAKVFDTPSKGPFNFTDDGHYSMPFKLTLTRQ